MDAPVSPARHARPVGPFAALARSISLALGAGRRGPRARPWPETGAARPASPAPRAAPTIEAALEDALRALGAEATRGRTRLTFAVAPGPMPRVDPGALGEVLRDAVGGAVRRSPYGEVLVCAASHGGRVRVSVTDGGAGTGEAALAGLSEATRGIVARHGGTLEARDRDGFATVVLCLPAPAAGPGRRPAASAAASTPRADGRAGSRAGGGVRGRSAVLIAEDDHLVRDMLASALEERCDVSCARTGERARALLLAGGLDGLVLDWRLADGAAGPVLREADRLGVPVLVVTGDPVAAAELGGRGRRVLAKPFGPGDLRAALDGALGGRRRAWSACPHPA